MRKQFTGDYSNSVKEFQQMDMKGVSKMADKIAIDEDKALGNVETAVDNIIASIQVLDENLGEVKITSSQEKEAIDKIRDLVDTAIAPYTGDVVKALEVFDEGEE